MRKKTTGRGAARAVGLLLTAAMAGTLLAGCGKDGAKDGTDGSRSGKGRFMEEEVSLPDGIDEVLTVRTLADGSIAAVGENMVEGKYYLLNSEDVGATWSSTSLDELDGENSWISISAIAPDGSAVLYGIDAADEDELKNVMWKVSPEGQVAAVPLELPEVEEGDSGTFYQKEMTWSYDGDTELPPEEAESAEGTETETGGESDPIDLSSTNDVQQMEYDDEGTLFCLDIYGAVYRVNTEDGSVEPVFDLSGDVIQYFGIAGHTFLGGTEDGLRLFDTTTEEELERQPVLDENNSEAQKDYTQTVLYNANEKPMLFTAGADDNIIYANRNGIYSYGMGGSVSEQLADGQLSSLCDPGNGLLSVAMSDANHIFILMYGEEGSRLMRYSYDENAAAVPEQELTVYSLEDSMALRQAVSLFRETYPDCYVNLQIGLSEEGMTREDALTALNTDIMAGNGPDVLILDGMQTDSYIDKDMLADITDLVDEIAEKDGIFDNVRSAYEIDGKLYAIPTRFLVPMSAGNSDGVAAGSDLAALADWAADAQGEGAVFAGQTDAAMLKELYQAFSSDWRQEDGTLDEEALKAFLSNAKTITEAIDGDSSEFADYQEIIAGGDSEGAVSGSVNGIHLLLGEAQLELGTVAGMENIQMLQALVKETGGSYALLNSAESGSFIPYLTAGVLEKGNTDMGREFVKLLLGSDLEMSDNGFPVNKTAYQKSCDKAMRDDTDYSQSIMAVEENGQLRDIRIEPLTQDEVDAVTAMLEGAGAPCLADATIEEQVLEQAVNYVSGGQDLDETVNNIQQKVSLYLAE